MMKKCKPGPAKYTLPTTVGFNDHDIRKNRLPAYSFGLRLPNDGNVRTPAPNTYILPSTFGGQDKVITFSSNSFGLILKCQHFQTVERAPAHSMSKTLTTKDHIESPAPNTYGLQNFDPGWRAPAYTIGARPENIVEAEEC